MAAPAVVAPVLPALQKSWHGHLAHDGNPRHGQDAHALGLAILGIPSGDISESPELRGTRYPGLNKIQPLPQGGCLSSTRIVRQIRLRAFAKWFGIHPEKNALRDVAADSRCRNPQT